MLRKFGIGPFCIKTLYKQKPSEHRPWIQRDFIVISGLRR